MNLKDFKSGYDAGSHAYREKAGQASYWITFFIALVLTEVMSRHWTMNWYSSLVVMILSIFVLSGLLKLGKKSFEKPPSK